MPLYFFHIRDGADLIADDEGEDLPDLLSVREVAITSAREIMSDGIFSSGYLGSQRYFDITDESGQTVMVLRFLEAIA